MNKTVCELKPIIGAAMLFFALNCLAPSALSSPPAGGAVFAGKTKSGKLPKEKSKFKIPKSPKKPPKYPKGPKVPKEKKLP